MAPPIDIKKLLSKAGYGAEIGRLRKAEAQQRAAARTILDPMDVAGEYDAARLLTTTLGGKIRAITLDDLRAFSAAANKLGKRFKGGITARGIIDASLAIDRDRANDQIRTAVVMKAQAGVLHFITNASAQSDAIRHHVHVEFPAFKAFAASPKKPDLLAKAMLDGPLKFDCDCGRHRFWFRYIATKGGFAHGRPETGFPKIRNPKLVGVACKHVLRVMQAVQKDANVRAKVSAMLAAAQRNDTSAQLTRAKEAQEQAAQQLQQSHHLKNRAETTAEIVKRRGGTSAAKIRALQKAAAEERRRAEQFAKKSRQERAADFAKLEKLLATMPLTKAMRDALAERLKTAKTVD